MCSGGRTARAGPRARALAPYPGTACGGNYSAEYDTCIAVTQQVRLGAVRDLLCPIPDARSVHDQEVHCSPVLQSLKKTAPVEDVSRSASRIRVGQEPHPSTKTQGRLTGASGGSAHPHYWFPRTLHIVHYKVLCTSLPTSRWDDPLYPFHRAKSQPKPCSLLLPKVFARRHKEGRTLSLL